jgi:hypothetical protein
MVFICFLDAVVDAFLGFALGRLPAQGIEVVHPRIACRCVVSIAGFETGESPMKCAEVQHGLWQHQVQGHRKTEKQCHADDSQYYKSNHFR